MERREPPPSQLPARLPSLLIALGGRVLPGGSRRTRYRQEFLAELHGMSPRRQTVHALQIVASSWSLRSATSDPHRERKTMTGILRSKPLMCLLNVRHHWAVESGPDGERYERCTKCGKDRMDYPWGVDPNGSNTIGA
jgi:hypothetical protein